MKPTLKNKAIRFNDADGKETWTVDNKVYTLTDSEPEDHAPKPQPRREIHRQRRAANNDGYTADDEREGTAPEATLEPEATDTDSDTNDTECQCDTKTGEEDDDMKVGEDFDSLDKIPLIFDPTKCAMSKKHYKRCDPVYIQYAKWIQKYDRADSSDWEE